MLSRIARGLYDLGRSVERAQNVARILEVNHKMNLERSALEDGEIWSAIADSFSCGLESPDERSLYGVLVLSSHHPYSVCRCIAEAREEGRAMREHISEEMWLHLNRAHLDFQVLTFDSVVSIGRSEFNRQVEVFADALHGLADDSMIRGPSWAFLKLGKLMERALMVCRILEIRRKASGLGVSGGPVDVYQWQALLRSLAGYEPYRRAYDARVVPSRVLEFVLQRREFPRSLSCSLEEMRGAFLVVSSGSALQLELEQRTIRILEDLRGYDVEQMLNQASFDVDLERLLSSLERLESLVELAYFTSHRPASAPISVAPGAGLVAQQ